MRKESKVKTRCCFILLFAVLYHLTLCSSGLAADSSEPNLRIRRLADVIRASVLMENVGWVAGDKRDRNLRDFNTRFNWDARFWEREWSDVNPAEWEAAIALLRKEIPDFDAMVAVGKKVREQKLESDFRAVKQKLIDSRLPLNFGTETWVSFQSFLRKSYLDSNTILEHLLYPFAYDATRKTLHSDKDPFWNQEYASQLHRLTLAPPEHLKKPWVDPLKLEEWKQTQIKKLTSSLETAFDKFSDKKNTTDRLFYINISEKIPQLIEFIKGLNSNNAKLKQKELASLVSSLELRDLLANDSGLERVGLSKTSWGGVINHLYWYAYGINKIGMVSVSHPVRWRERHPVLFFPFSNRPREFIHSHYINPFGDDTQTFSSLIQEGPRQWWKEPAYYRAAVSVLGASMFLSYIQETVKSMAGKHGFDYSVQNRLTDPKNKIPSREVLFQFFDIKPGVSLPEHFLRPFEKENQFFRYHPTGKNSDFKMKTPNRGIEDQTNIELPIPLGSELTYLKLTDKKGTELKDGVDFRVMKDIRSGGMKVELATQNDDTNHGVIYLEAGIQLGLAPTDPEWIKDRALSNMDLDVVRSLAEDLRRGGWIPRARRLSELVDSKEKLGEPLKLDDLIPILSDGYYSYAKQGKLKESSWFNLFDILTPFQSEGSSKHGIEAGEFFGQCDSAFKFAQIAFDVLTIHSRGVLGIYQPNPELLYVREPEENVLRASGAHVRLALEKNNAPGVLRRDTTPFKKDSRNPKGPTPRPFFEVPTFEVRTKRREETEEDFPEENQRRESLMKDDYGRDQILQESAQEIQENLDKLFKNPALKAVWSSEGNKRYPLAHVVATAKALVRMWEGKASVGDVSQTLRTKTGERESAFQLATTVKELQHQLKLFQKEQLRLLEEGLKPVQSKKSKLGAEMLPSEVQSAMKAILDRMTEREWTPRRRKAAYRLKGASDCGMTLEKIYLIP